MEKYLLEPGRLLSDEKEEDKQTLDCLRAVNEAFDETVARQLQDWTRKLPVPHKTVDLEHGMEGTRIEKSAEDSFIGANAISMVNPLDSNATDMTALVYVGNNAKDYLLCAKSDGVRYLLFVASNGRTFVNDRKNQFFEVGLALPPFFYQTAAKDDATFRVEFIFDGELILNTEEGERLHALIRDGKKVTGTFHYLAFDTLKYKGEITAFKKYSDRIHCISLFQNNIMYFDDFFGKTLKQKNKAHKQEYAFNIKFFLKDFYTCKQIDFLLNDVVEGQILPHQNDGIILTKNNYPYLPGKDKGILKWKPAELNTLDFFICENDYYSLKYEDLFGDSDFFVFELYTVYGNELYFFDFLFVMDQADFLEIQSHFRTMNIGNLQYEGCIVECNYNYTQASEKMSNFYDFIYHNDSESAESIIRKSKYFNQEKYEGWVDKGATQGNRTTFIDEVTLLIFKTFQNRSSGSGGSRGITGGWSIMRYRDDKEYPNNFKTAFNIFATIFESNIEKNQLILALQVPAKKLKT
jgi:hypothetical protein